jgi:hypothetical protein
MSDRVRVARDAVTGKLESTVLDAVQLSFEKIIAHVDGMMLRLPSDADRDRLARYLIERIERMKMPEGER